MELALAEYSGFCQGVRRAVKLAEESVSRDSSVCVLGDLVHNKSVMAKLQALGLNVVDEKNVVRCDKVLIRAHGQRKETVQFLDDLGVEVVDLTCPYVKRIHTIVEDMAERGLTVMVFGESEHPEVQGIISHGGRNPTVITSSDDFSTLSPSLSSFGLVAQTTANRKEWEKLITLLTNSGKDIEVVDTICDATTLRQQSTVDLARQADIMLIVGGHNSSNTKRLWELCHNMGVPAYHIESADEINLSWFNDSIDLIGISAGASTPDWTIEEVIVRMEKLVENQNIEEQVAEENQAEVEEVKAEEEVVEASTTPEGDEEQAMYEDDIPNLKPRTIVRGKVVRVGDDEVFVDIGYKSEGIISLRELTSDSTLTPADVVSEEEEIDVYVLRVADQNGNPVLSKRRADSVRSWDTIKTAFEDEARISGQVQEVVKGGLIVKVDGLRAFMPASLVDRRFVADLSEFVGQEVEARIIELDRAKRRIVLSRQAVLEEEYDQQRDKTWQELEEGQVREGVVQRLTAFGAFVDLGSVDGLVHISELSWGRVDHPSEVVKEGEKVKVKILSVDQEKERVSLSLRQTLADPWSTVAERYEAGSVVEGKVVRTVGFGAFVELEPGVEGLVHISQLAWRHVENCEDVVKPGDTVNVKVLSVNSGEKRISLSIKETTERPQRERRQPSNKVSHSESGSLTLGDMFGDLLNKAKQKEE